MLHLHRCMEQPCHHSLQACVLQGLHYGLFQSNGIAIIIFYHAFVSVICKSKKHIMHFRSLFLKMMVLEQKTYFA